MGCFLHIIQGLLLVISVLDVVTPFELTILHTNDVHARFEQYTLRDGRCHEDDAKGKGCFGGLARRTTLIKEFRNRKTNVVLLDAGDQYQGTPWFYYYKGKAASHFMNELLYDAMSLGNHEFDNGIEGLIPFLRNITFPVVCANIIIDEEPGLFDLINRSTILEVGGQRIGVVGYLTKDTPTLANTGRLKFKDEVTAVQEEVDRLTANGVTMIIGLGHAGFKIDVDIAKQVKGMDVVIGGHTNTFLYSGPAPSKEQPEGPYPLVITQENGDRVLVLEAYAFGKYLGYLELIFDDKGRVANWTGNPILLDKRVKQNEQILSELGVWGAKVQELYSSVVGFSDEFLDGDFTHCRLEECVLGNLITDALVDHYQCSGNWRDLRIALMNGGGIRSSIEKGNITYESVLQTLPFGNGIDVLELTGHDLIQILEFSVANYSRGVRNGKFLQMSGLRVMYDLTNANGARVKSLEVVCGNCTDRVFSPIKKDTVYQLAIPSYLVAGGDGYTFISQLLKHHYNLGDVDADIFVGFLHRRSPVRPRVEGRIRFSVNATNRVTSDAPKSNPIMALNILVLILTGRYGFVVFVCAQHVHGPLLKST